MAAPVVIGVGLVGVGVGVVCVGGFVVAVVRADAAAGWAVWGWSAVFGWALAGVVSGLVGLAVLGAAVLR